MEYNETPRVHTPPVKWLRILFYLHGISLILAVLSLLPVNDTLFTWISRASKAGAVVCLFLLVPLHPRFRKAAGFSLAAWITALGASAGILGIILLLTSSICSIVGVYHEYSTFSEITAQSDPVLGKRWKGLFYWELLSGVILGTVGSLIGTVLVLVAPESGTLVSTGISWALEILTLVLQGMYLWYLRRTTLLLKEKSEL